MVCKMQIVTVNTCSHCCSCLCSALKGHFTQIIKKSSSLSTDFTGTIYRVENSPSEKLLTVSFAEHPDLENVIKNWNIYFQE